MEFGRDKQKKISEEPENDEIDLKAEGIRFKRLTGLKEKFNSLTLSIIVALSLLVNDHLARFTL